MNCKPGDLAIIVRGWPEFLGQIVQVVRPYLGNDFEDKSPAWVVLHDGVEWHCNDHVLRPIRDNDGTDETLTWAGKPEQVSA